MCNKCAMPGKRKRPFVGAGKRTAGYRRGAYKARRVGVLVPRYAARFAGGAAEQKFFDTTLQFSFDTTMEVPATGQLSLIPQGVTESTRVGRKCLIKSIKIQARLRLVPGASTNSSTGCHLFLILDKQANGAAAAVTDVFTNTTVYLANRNLSNSSRFVILKKWRKMLKTGAGVSAAYGTDSQYIDFYKKCNIPLEFSSTTGAITELKSNNLFLIAASDAMDDNVDCDGSCRLRFSDG